MNGCTTSPRAALAQPGHANVVMQLQPTEICSGVGLHVPGSNFATHSTVHVHQREKVHFAMPEFTIAQHGWSKSNVVGQGMGMQTCSQPRTKWVASEMGDTEHWFCGLEHLKCIGARKRAGDPGASTTPVGISAEQDSHML